MTSISETSLPSLLYVDDEQENLDNFKYLFMRDYKVYTALSAAAGYEILAKNDIHVIIADQRMPVETGVDFLSKVLSMYPDAVRMILTGYSDISAVVDAINKGKIYHYFKKPFDRDSIKLIADNALEVVALEQKNARLMEDLKRANQELEERSEQLEKTVEKRTHELKREVEERKQYAEELERFNKSMLGREMRVIDLKREVNECLTELKRPPRYKIVDSGSSDDER